MRYAISHVAPTFVHGGILAGQKVIHVGLTGCQLWSGYGTQREQSGASCAHFCDSQLHGGQVVEREALLDRIAQAAVDKQSGVTTTSTVWLSGGEPTLQLDQSLIYALKEDGWKVCLETNGLKSIEWMRQWLDHVRVCPKDAYPLSVTIASEVFVGVWQSGPEPELLTYYEEQISAAAYYLTPYDPPVADGPEVLTLLRHGDGPDEAVATAARFQLEQSLLTAYRLIDERPKWRFAPPANRMLGLEW